MARMSSKMACILACGYLEGLSTASSSVASRERLVELSDRPVRAIAISSASLEVAAGVGFALRLAAITSLANFCFCSAEKLPVAWKAANADCNRVRLWFWAGGAAAAGGGGGVTGAAMPWRTLL